jgi:hypothetical protein
MVNKVPGRWKNPERKKVFQPKIKGKDLWTMEN